MKPEQTLKLEDVKNMPFVYVIASGILKVHEIYYCMIAGKRTAIVK